MAEEADASFMTTVLEDISVERIIEYAEENGIDFIVIGTPAVQLSIGRWPAARQRR